MDTGRTLKRITCSWRFAGPSMIGALKQLSGGFTVPLVAVSAVLLLGAVTIAWLGDPGANAGEAPSAKPLNGRNGSDHGAPGMNGAGGNGSTPAPDESSS